MGCIFFPSSSYISQWTVYILFTHRETDERTVWIYMLVRIYIYILATAESIYEEGRPHRDTQRERAGQLGVGPGIYFLPFILLRLVSPRGGGSRIPHAAADNPLSFFLSLSLSLSLSVVVSLLLYLKHSFFSSSSSSVSFSVIMLVHLALASHAAGVIYTLSHPQHRFASTDSAPPTLKQQEVTKPSLYMWFFLLSLSTNHQQRGQRRLEGEITAKMHGKLFLTPWKITRKKRKEKKKFGFPRRRRYIRQ